MAASDGTRGRRQGEKVIITIVTLPLTGPGESGSPLQSVKCIPKELVSVRGQEGEYLADRGSTKGSMLPLVGHETLQWNQRGDSCRH